MKAEKEKQYLFLKIAKRPLYVIAWVLVGLVLLFLLKFPINYYFLDWEIYCSLRPNVDSTVAQASTKEVRELLRQHEIKTTVGHNMRYGSSTASHVNVLKKDFDRAFELMLPLDEGVWKRESKVDDSNTPWYNKVFW